jgi:1,2-diacylglycerol 3-alpha-glucosyltransferase
MRIAMYTDAFHPFSSGVTTAVIASANMLASGGHQVFIQAPRPKNPVDLSFLHANVQVHFVRAIDVVIYKDFRLGTSIPLFLKEIKAFQPEIIHVHTPGPVGLEGTMVAKRLKLPCVQTFHTYYTDPDNLRMFGLSNQSIGQLYEQGSWKALKALTRFYAATFTPSEYVKNDLLEHTFPGKIIVTPNVLSSHAVAPPLKTRRKPTRFIYVARQSPEKRIDLLLRTFAKLVTKNPEFELHLIGDGPAQDDLFHLSQQLKIGQHIRWYGRIPHDDLMRDHLYQNGDIFLSASRYETFGYTTLEAIAQGLPVVTVDFRANAEIVGDAGWLIQNTEDEELFIRRLAKAAWDASQSDINTVRTHAKHQAQKYTAEYLLPIYEAAYQTVLSDSETVQPS